MASFGKIKKRDFIQYALCYLLILTAGATLWTYVLGGVGFKAVIVLVINVLVIMKYRIRIPQGFIVYSVFTMALLMALSLITDGGIFSGNDLNSTLSMVIYAMTAFVVYAINPENASKIFIKTVCFFAAISIFFFIIQVVIGPSAFPEFLFRDVNYRSEYGFLLYTICKSNMRNYGIFYEPGVYQTVLSAAIYLAMFDENLILSGQKKRYYLAILSIAMFTTRSTTAYISLAILFAFYVLGGKGSKKIKTGLVILLVFGAIGADYLMNGQESLLYTIVLGKFAEINFNNGRYRYGTSGGARVYLIDIALQVLSSKPLTGIGSIAYFSKYLSGTVWESGGTGNILCITIAKRGIVFTFFSIFYFLRKAFINRSSIYAFVAYLLIFFNTIFAQSQLVYGVLAFAAFVMCEKKDT